jgi:hypothetical protein
LLAGISIYLRGAVLFREISLPDIVVEALSEHRRQQRAQRVALGLGKLT